MGSQRVMILQLSSGVEYIIVGESPRNYPSLKNNESSAPSGPQLLGLSPILKTDINFKGTNTRHMSQSAIISFLPRPYL